MNPQVFTNDRNPELYGVAKEDEATYNTIFWSGVEGSRRVILRKVLAVTKGYEPVVGASFDVYTDPELHNYAKGIVKTESGETTVELKSLPSGASGILWIGELPYGTYYLKESNPSRVFILTVDKDGVGYLSTVGEQNNYSNKINAE